MNKQLQSGILALAVMSGSSIYGQIITIDNFQTPALSDGASVTTWDNVTVTQFGVGGSTTGDRTFVAEIDSFESSNAFATSLYDSNANVGILAANGGDTGIDFWTRLTWGDVFPIATPNFSGILGPNFDFVLSVPEITGTGPFGFGFLFCILRTGYGDETKFSYALSDVNPGSNLTFRWNASEFTDADLTKISGVGISVGSVLEAGDHFSLTISDFRAVAVPEPMEYGALVGAGLVMFAFWRRSLTKDSRTGSRNCGGSGS